MLYSNTLNNSNKGFSFIIKAFSLLYLRFCLMKHRTLGNLTGAIAPIKGEGEVSLEVRSLNTVTAPLSQISNILT